MSAFRPAYEEGDVEGLLPTLSRFRTILALLYLTHIPHVRSNSLIFQAIPVFTSTLNDGECLKHTSRLGWLASTPLVSARSSKTLSHLLSSQCHQEVCWTIPRTEGMSFRSVRFHMSRLQDGLICMLNIEHILDGRTFPLAWPHSTSAIANPISPPAWFTASYCPRG